MAVVVVVVFDIFIFPYGFSGYGGGLVFAFVCGFGSDYGLWLKWWFGSCVGGGLAAVVLVWCLILTMGFGCYMAFLQCVMYMNFAKMARILQKWQ